MRHESSLSPRYFEEMFQGNPDPWSFETSAYEQEKYARTLAALGGRRYGAALEIGCANGVLTRRLAAHCDALLATDVSATALGLAAQRCRDMAHVRFAQACFPHDLPVQTGFDLILLSEVAYYWDDADLARAAAALRSLAAAGGELLLVHWTGETDYPQSGDDAVATLRRHLPDFAVVAEQRQPQYRLDHWRRR